MSKANQGKAWEALLEAWHSRYLATGQAWIVPAPPQVKVLKMLPSGRFTGCFKSDGPPDYCGSVAGQAVAFDAKSTCETRWRLSAVSEGQAAHLDAAHRCGAFAFVALQHPSGQWAIPWATLGPMWHAWRLALRTGYKVRGRASLTPEQVADMGIQFGAHGWISAMGAP